MCHFANGFYMLLKLWCQPLLFTYMRKEKRYTEHNYLSYTNYIKEIKEGVL